MELLLVCSLAILGRELAVGPPKPKQRKHIEILNHPNVITEYSPSNDHNMNTEPFFTSAKAQNTNDAVKHQYMETFTGNDQNMFQHKREVENSNLEHHLEHGQVFGTQNLTGAQYNDEVNRFKNSLEGVNWMNNTLPFEQEKVGPGLNIGPETAAKGGFHDTFRILPDNVNSYKKNTFQGRVIPGKAENSNQTLHQEVTKQKNDTFYSASKHPHMPTKTDFTAHEVMPQHLDSNSQRGTCTDYLSHPHQNTHYSYTNEHTRIYDSSNCEKLGNPHNQNQGNFIPQTFLTHSTDREQCAQLSNTFINSGHVVNNKLGTQATMRETVNENIINAHIEKQGVNPNKYEAYITQREDSTLYHGNPGTSTVSSTRNQHAHSTQRGDKNTYDSGVHGINKMKNYSAELNADPYLSKESALFSRAGGAQNINVLDDPTNIYKSTYCKPDCSFGYNGNGFQNGNYGNLGDTEHIQYIPSDTNRNDFTLASSQLQNNSFAIPSFDDSSKIHSSHEISNPELTKNFDGCNKTP